MCGRSFVLYGASAMKWDTSRRFIYSALVLPFALGCAPSEAKSPKAGAESQGAEDQEREQEKVPLPPLEPASAPPGVFFRSRLRTPELVIDRTLQAAGLPFRARDWLEDNQEGFLLLPTSELDLGGSIESIVMLNPVPERVPFAVVSASVRSLEGSLSALKGARVDAMEGPSGVYYFSDELTQCALGRSVGPEAGRVVCSDSAEALSALLPYALRGFPAEASSGPTGWFEVDLAPIREAYGQRAKSLRLLASIGARQLHIDHPRFDRALTEAAVSIADELGDLLSDGERVRGEFEQTERGDVRLSLLLGFRGTSSWVAGTTADWASSGGPAPALFSTLPGSAAAAGAFQTLPNARRKKLSEVLTDLAAGYFESKRAKPSEVRDVETVVRELFAREGAIVQATGPLQGALPDPWGLYGTSRGKKEVVAFFDSLGRVGSSSAWKQMAPELSDLLEIKRSSERVAGAPQAVVYRYRLGSSAKDWLDSGSLLGDSLGAQRDTFPLEGRIAVHSVESVTYVVHARSLGSLSEPFAAMADANSPRLGKNAELRGLFTTSAVARGFARVEGLAAPFLPWLPEKVQNKLEELVRATPNGGDVPLTYTVQAKKRGEGAELAVHYDVPSAFIGDVAALIALAMTD